MLLLDLEFSLDARIKTPLVVVIFSSNEGLCRIWPAGQIGPTNWLDLAHSCPCGTLCGAKSHLLLPRAACTALLPVPANGPVPNPSVHGFLVGLLMMWLQLPGELLGAPHLQQLLLLLCLLHHSGQ